MMAMSLRTIRQVCPSPGISFRIAGVSKSIGAVAFWESFLCQNLCSYHVLNQGSRTAKTTDTQICNVDHLMHPQVAQEKNQNEGRSTVCIMAVLRSARNGIMAWFNTRHVWGMLEIC